MKTKKLIALGLITCLSVSMTACGGKATKGSKTADAKQTNSKVHTYSVMGQQSASSGDWNDYWLFDKIEKDLKMKFKITMVSTEGQQEKKNIGLASGEYPDFYLGGMLTEDDIANYSAQGIFLPLEKYINEKYTPNLVKAFKEYPDLKASLYSPDGHIYNITGMNADPKGQNKYNAWINTEWAKKLNVPVPKTLKEYHDYLVAVKNGDPNGNGKKDEIPLGGRYNTEYFRNLIPILNAFGMTENGYEAVKGKVQFNPAEPAYKDFLKYMNQLWSEGLIDPEYFTQSEEQYFAKEVQGVYGTFSDYAQWVHMYNEKDVWGQYDAWDPMTSDKNDKQIWPAYSVSPIGSFVITDKCKDPQDLMRLVNWFYDTEHSDWSVQGVPVGQWPDDPSIGWTTKDVKGGREVVSKWPKEYADYQSFSHQKCTADYGTFPNMPSTDMVASGPQKVLEDAISKHKVPFYNVGWPTLKYTADEADQIQLIQVEITNYMEQMFSKFVTGEEPISKFDDYVKGLKDRNLGKLLKIQQKAYDRWAKKENK